MSNRIHIVNASRRVGWPTGTPVYVSRPHVLGNPFTVGKDGTRSEVIDKYELWLIDHQNAPRVAHALQMLKLILEHDDLLLVCWCHPQRCHCDVIKRYLARHDTATILAGG